MIRACSIALLVFGLRLSASGQASNHPAQLAPGGRSHHSWTNAALEEVQVAADQGQAEAAFELFTRYNHGTQRINDDPQVIRWLAQAAEGNGALQRLVDLLSRGTFLDEGFEERRLGRAGTDDVNGDAHVTA